MNKEMVQAICRAVQETVSMLRDHQWQASVLTSNDHLLIDADLLADDWLRCRLLQLVDCAYVSEESTGDFVPSMWVVDPLDGTANYIAQDAPWAVSVALVNNWRVVAGVVCVWPRGGLHTMATTEEYSVSDRVDLSGGRLATDWTKRPHDRDVCALLSKLRQRSSYPRITGCCSAALVSVATGKLDAFVHFAPQPFDFAAGAAIVEATGGVVTDTKGQPWSVHSKSVVATNGLVHDAMLALLKEI